MESVIAAVPGSWTQRTLGARASGVLTVREGTQTQSFTLAGSYTAANFSVTSDGHGGTLITDPPVTNDGSVAASAETSSGGNSIDTVSGSAATVVSGGYELGTSGGAAGDTDSCGGIDRGAFFSSGMAQLDALLSRFAGFISGFDLCDEIDLRSLGFGSSSSAMSLMQQASAADGGGPAGVNGGGDLFSLTLLGQYAANFNAGADGHDGPMITDPAASGSVAPTPSVVAHS
jgi:hypothetical protein